MGGDIVSCQRERGCIYAGGGDGAYCGATGDIQNRRGDDDASRIGRVEGRPRTGGGGATRTEERFTTPSGTVLENP